MKGCLVRFIVEENLRTEVENLPKILRLKKDRRITVS